MSQWTRPVGPPSRVFADDTADDSRQAVAAVLKGVGDATQCRGHVAYYAHIPHVTLIVNGEPLVGWQTIRDYHVHASQLIPAAARSLPDFCGTFARGWPHPPGSGVPRRCSPWWPAWSGPQEVLAVLDGPMASSSSMGHFAVKSLSCCGQSG
jgi:hypothetical protein